MKIIYLSFSKLKHSVNSVYIKGLKRNGVIIDSFVPSKKGFRRYLELMNYYKKNGKDANFIMVGYNSPQIAVLMKLISRKKIVYNALCSVYERLVVSRNLASKISIKSFYYWLLDFFAAHFSSLIMLETNQQIRYFKKLFKVPERKVFRAWSGVDDEKFFYDSAVPKFNNFTVIFRGSLLPEAGIEYAIWAAKKLENESIKFIFLVHGLELGKNKNLIIEPKPKNLEMITDFLPDDQLRELMQNSHLNIGHLSNHPRIERTIPHRAFESLALRVPYLTARSRGVAELLKDRETCIFSNPADSDDLAKKILWANENPKELEKIAENAYKLYIDELKSEILAKKLLEKITVNP